MFDSLDVSASALSAQRARMDTISGNVANMNTTRNEKGEPVPYRRRFVVLASGTKDAEGGDVTPGVHVQTIGQDPSPFRSVFDPGNPDADKDGNVWYPNVDLAIEQVNMMEASRAYEANVTMMDTEKAMISSALRLIA
ncbi:MAG: flagellar basal body rod protein FlgC [Phycisphaerae bacterium]|nr:flagellar basal body rod protein FlgC [Phycisphaerae bacterium]